MDPVKATPIAERGKAESLLDFGIVSFQRIVAAIFLGFTIFIWMRAVGFWAESGIRFDTMNTETKVYIALLAVLFPITSVGLWTTLSWGRVVWFLSAGVQLVAFAAFSDEILVENRFLIIHAFCISTYLAMVFWLYLIEKKE